MHQLISDQPLNSNKIYANRYQGLIGIWYFMIDSVVHSENFLAVILLITMYYSQKYHDQVHYSFAIVAFTVNVSLMCIRNITFEHR